MSGGTCLVTGFLLIFIPGVQALGSENEMTVMDKTGTRPQERSSARLRWIVLSITLAWIMVPGVVLGATSTPITGPVVISTPGNYYLANNIATTNSTAILITVPNVVLDGKGKTIDGVDAANSVGILVYNSAMTLFNVIIKNVVVTEWATGVQLHDVRNSQLEKVTASGNANGIALQVAMRNTVKTCTAIGNTNLGIVLYEYSDSNTISGNTLTGNGLDGLRIRYSSNNDVTNNKMLSNNGAGINFAEAGNFNTVTGNTITGNLGDAVYVWKSSGNIITKNTMRNNGANGVNIKDQSYNNEVSANTVQNSTYNGVLMWNDANGNTAFGNTFDLNGDSGVRIVRSDRNEVYNNYVRNNIGNGIYMWDSGSNVIVNNYFYNNNNTAIVPGLQANTWSLPRSALTSITGGANSGGNSWGQPNGQGFSQVTPATNGICNSPYTVAKNNIDQLPLKWAKK